jgi:mannosyltransferase OCH1-like enzyme
MPIPKICHQLWKDTEIPKKWQASHAANKRILPDWEHILWTDDKMDDYVKKNHPEFYPIYAGFNRHIMRVDVFRYILMHDIGGIYCDMDFEFLRPFDFSQDELVMSMERDINYGDAHNGVANYFFASAPGHQLWKDCLADLQNNPPSTDTYLDVLKTTGPGFLSRIFFANCDQYESVNLTPRPAFSPYRTHGPNERKHYLNSGMTYGFHIGAGTWKERGGWLYWKRKLGLA